MIQGTKIYEVTVSNGKVDNHKASDYENFDVNTVNQESKETFMEKAKALSRFYTMTQALSKGLDTMVEIETIGDDYKTVASSMTFKLVYTQDDGLWVECNKDTENAKELRDGRFIVSGKDAIKEIITKTLSKQCKQIIEYFEPRYSQTVDDNGGKNPSTAPYGWGFEMVDVEPSNPTVEVKEVADLSSVISLL